MTSSISSPRAFAKPLLAPTMRKPHFSSTRIEPTLSFAATP
jgi:hypothetical protein